MRVFKTDGDILSKTGPQAQVKLKKLLSQNTQNRKSFPSNKQQKF